MAEELKSGSLLVRANVRLPESLESEGQLLLPDWEVLSGVNTAKLDRELTAAGWHFFFVVDPSRQATGFAFGRDPAIWRALRTLIRRTESKGLNALEIAEISLRRVLFFYVARIRVNFRHIGDTPFLFGATKHAKQPEQLGRAAKTA